MASKITNIEYEIGEDGKKYAILTLDPTLKGKGRKHGMLPGKDTISEITRVRVPLPEEKVKVPKEPKVSTSARGRPQKYTSEERKAKYQAYQKAYRGKNKERMAAMRLITASMKEGKQAEILGVSRNVGENIDVREK